MWEQSHKERAMIILGGFRRAGEEIGSLKVPQLHHHTHTPQEAFSIPAGAQPAGSYGLSQPQDVSLIVFCFLPPLGSCQLQPCPSCSPRHLLLRTLIRQRLGFQMSVLLQLPLPSALDPSLVVGWQGLAGGLSSGSGFWLQAQSHGAFRSGGSPVVAQTSPGISSQRLLGVPKLHCCPLA